MVPGIKFEGEKSYARVQKSTRNWKAKANRKSPWRKRRRKNEKNIENKTRKRSEKQTEKKRKKRKRGKRQARTGGRRESPGGPTLATCGTGHWEVTLHDDVQVFWFLLRSRNERKDPSRPLTLTLTLTLNLTPNLTQNGPKLPINAAAPRLHRARKLL